MPPPPANVGVTRRLVGRRRAQPGESGQEAGRPRGSCVGLDTTDPGGAAPGTPRGPGTQVAHPGPSPPPRAWLMRPEIDQPHSRDRQSRPPPTPGEQGPRGQGPHLVLGPQLLARGLGGTGQLGEWVGGCVAACVWGWAGAGGGALVRTGWPGLGPWPRMLLPQGGLEEMPRAHSPALRTGMPPNGHPGCLGQGPHAADDWGPSPQSWPIFPSRLGQPIRAYKAQLLCPRAKVKTGRGEGWGLISH